MSTTRVYITLVSLALASCTEFAKSKGNIEDAGRFARLYRVYGAWDRFIGTRDFPTVTKKDDGTFVAKFRNITPNDQGMEPGNRVVYTECPKCENPKYFDVMELRVGFDGEEYYAISIIPLLSRLNAQNGLEGKEWSPIISWREIP